MKYQLRLSTIIRRRIESRATLNRPEGSLSSEKWPRVQGAAKEREAPAAVVKDVKGCRDWVLADSIKDMKVAGPSRLVRRRR
jgi:hypothetical protein